MSNPAFGSANTIKQQGSGTTLTSNTITVSAGQSLFCVMEFNATTADPNNSGGSVKWNTSETMTKVGSTATQANTRNTAVYWIKNPTATTASVVITFGNSASPVSVVTCWTMTNAGSIGAVNTATGSGVTSASISLSGMQTSNTLGVLGAQQASGSPLTMTSGTARNQQSDGTASCFSIADNTVSGTSTTLSGTFSPSGIYAWVAFEVIAPASLGGTITATARGLTTASFTVAAVGGTGVYSTYQWQQKAVGGAYSNVGSNSTTYNASGLNQGTEYLVKCTITDNSAASADSSEIQTWALPNNTNLFFSPYNWQSDGSGTLQSNNILPSSTAAICANVGGYLKTKVVLPSSSSKISLKLDTTSLQTLTASKCPTIYYRVYTSTATIPSWSSQLIAYSASVASYDLGTSLAAGTYFVDVIIKSIDFTLDANDVRWSVPKLSMKVLGLEFTADGSLSAPTLRTKRMLFIGDSLIEGAASAANATTNAGTDFTLTFSYLMGQAFDAEFGTRGYGGCGYIRGINNVAASSTNPCIYSSTANNRFYDKYYSGASCLVAGLYSPAPDYIVIHAGYNDAGSLVASDVTAALDAIRTAAPNAWIFACSSNQGTNSNASKIQTGVANVATPGRTLYLAPTQLFTPGTASPFSNDAGSGGAHSALLGHATTGMELTKGAQDSIAATGGGGGAFCG